MACRRTQLSAKSTGAASARLARGKPAKGGCSSYPGRSAWGIDESSRAGWSVIIRGVTDQVTNPTEVRRLNRLGLEPWAPGPKRHWMHIRAWTVAGRRIVLGDESFPGYYLG